MEEVYLVWLTEDSEEGPHEYLLDVYRDQDRAIGEVEKHTALDPDFNSGRVERKLLK